MYIFNYIVEKCKKKHIIINNNNKSTKQNQNKNLISLQRTFIPVVEAINRMPTNREGL